MFLRMIATMKTTFASYFEKGNKSQNYLIGPGSNSLYKLEEIKNNLTKTADSIEQYTGLTKTMCLTCKDHRWEIETNKTFIEMQGNSAEDIPLFNLITSELNNFPKTNIRYKECDLYIPIPKTPHFSPSRALYLKQQNKRLIGKPTKNLFIRNYILLK